MNLQDYNWKFYLLLLTFLVLGLYFIMSIGNSLGNIQDKKSNENIDKETKEIIQLVDTLIKKAYIKGQVDALMGDIRIKADTSLMYWKIIKDIRIETEIDFKKIDKSKLKQLY